MAHTSLIDVCNMSIQRHMDFREAISLVLKRQKTE